MTPNDLSRSKILLLVAAICLIAAAPLRAADAEIKHGAQLYDKWFKLTGSTPQGNHPLYPADAKKSGDTTWRCKECHGWDTLGRDGRYASGSHYTGIAGLRASAGRSAADISSAMTAAHDFGAGLSAADLKALARFLGEGQADTARAIDAEGTGRGDASRGATLYADNCAACHGGDGETLDFKSDKEGVQGVGWLARDNPQESLHKIRWGHPGSDMPSLLADSNGSEQDAIDILTYTQTLP